MKSRARLLLLGYALLLAASTAYRLLVPVDGVPDADQQTVDVAEIDGGRPTANHVHIAYRDLGEASGPPVLLLHGTPVASGAMMPLAQRLGQRYRVVVPDLPGFGGSSLRVADYSIRAHAVYMLEVLDQLGLDSVHVVAYSQGGGAALSLAGMAPQRVRSLSLVSSIGVQELELLGDYHLNRALYVAQLGFLQALEWLLPHFGYLDDAILNLAYARNVYDSDQRPLRELLERFPGPMLVVHGRDDGFVPLAAALEHHRIVPQSELFLVDGGHMVVFADPGQMADPIDDFLQRVERGTATAHTAATAERLQLAQAPFDWREVPAFEGITLVIVLFLLAIATYISEDVACITGGLMVARGVLEFVPATSACLVGIFTGDLLLFLAGKFLGPPALMRAPLKWFVYGEKLLRSRAWFRSRGPAVIFLSRFVPGTRLPTYLVAGLLQMSLLRFSLYFLLAALVWTPLLVGGAYLVGAGALEQLQAYQHYSIPLVIVLIITLWVAVRVVVPLFSFRGRRLLLSAWRRKSRWEFWPMWVFYPPLVIYILYLGVRYRSLTLFTASNPAIPASGFVGESKSAILDGFKDAGDHIARYLLVPPASSFRQQELIDEFMRDNALGYPIVLKPDVGERGKGVLVAKDASAIAAYLANTTERLIVQEYAPGQEFGVFYYRMPTESKGRIFAVTDKRPPEVTGDGRYTLEELILADDRAVCMAETFLNRHADRLFDVPAAGERIVLVDVGTHSMGCLFVDGSWVVTPELEAEIDRVTRKFDGFYFGRYDIRTPDVTAFRRGENYKVIELNGVTSEATNIYDPHNSLLKAYTILFRQWHLAFRIGAENRSRGIQPVSVGELLRMVAKARRPHE